MGNNVKQNVIIQVAYCGGCGWSTTAKKVCDSIKTKLPKAVIDCRPEQIITGVLQINLIVEGQGKQNVFKGTKEQIMANYTQISDQVAQAYEQI